MKSFIALPALAALASAVPFAKRDVVWVTATDVVTEVINVTKTVWVDDADATESPVAEAQEKDVPAPQQKNNNNDRPHNHANFHNAQSKPTPVSTVVVSTTASATPASVPSSTIVQPVVTSTTAVYVAPAPVTTPQTTPQITVAVPTQAPVQTSSPSPAPQSSAPAPQSSAPAAYSPPASYGASGGDCSGQSGTCDSAKFTYYTPGMGSCGDTDSDSDYIFAYGKDLMAAKGGANPNLNPLCGRKIQIKAYDGSMVTATLKDTCYACAGNAQMLDLSQGLWERIAKGNPAADGVMTGMSFTWL